MSSKFHKQQQKAQWSATGTRITSSYTRKVCAGRAPFSLSSTAVRDSTTIQLHAAEQHRVRHRPSNSEGSCCRLERLLHITELLCRVGCSKSEVMRFTCLFQCARPLQLNTFAFIMQKICGSVSTLSTSHQQDDSSDFEVAVALILDLLFFANSRPLHRQVLSWCRSLPAHKYAAVPPLLVAQVHRAVAASNCKVPEAQPIAFAEPMLSLLEFKPVQMPLR